MMNTMDGYITKQQAYDIVLYLDDELVFIPNVNYDKILSLLYNEISNFPSADIVPVSMSQWEEAEDGYIIVCSSIIPPSLAQQLETTIFFK